MSRSNQDVRVAARVVFDMRAEEGPVLNVGRVVDHVAGALDLDDANHPRVVHAIERLESANLISISERTGKMIVDPKLDWLASKGQI